jgi:hypothetical protein
MKGGYFTLFAGHGNDPQDSCTRARHQAITQQRSAPATLAFSKNVAHHIGASRYCLCHYHLTRARVLRLEHDRSKVYPSYHRIVPPWPAVLSPLVHERALPQGDAREVSRTGDHVRRHRRG